MTHELKPCPFCGGPATMQQQADKINCFCNDCGAKVRERWNHEFMAAHINPSTAAYNAIANDWNKRAKTTAQEGA